MTDVKEKKACKHCSIMSVIVFILFVALLLSGWYALDLSGLLRLEPVEGVKADGYKLYEIPETGVVLNYSSSLELKRSDGEYVLADPEKGVVMALTAKQKVGFIRDWGFLVNESRLDYSKLGVLLDDYPIDIEGVQAHAFELKTTYLGQDIFMMCTRMLEDNGLWFMDSCTAGGFSNEQAVREQCRGIIGGMSVKQWMEVKKPWGV